MAWSRIIGHSEVVERFRQTLERGRLSHAYLFVGPEGIGKELFALELAKAVQCPSGPQEACDHCPSCQKVEHGNHPDVTFLRRITQGAKGERRAAILIDQVREAIQEPIALKPYEGCYKVFVVVEAERMTEEAQNCLLKTLEEPPPQSLLILVAARLEPFVDTVVSRCQIVRFRPLREEDAARILVAGHGVEPQQAATLARLAAGSPGKALHYQTTGAYDVACWLLERLASMRVGEEFLVAAELLERARDSGATLEDARDQLRPVLDLMALAWRDLLIRAAGYPRDMLTWGASCEGLDALSANVSATTARRLVAMTVEARDRVDANANIRLLVETWLLHTSQLLWSRGAAPGLREGAVARR